MPNRFKRIARVVTSFIIAITLGFFLASPFICTYNNMELLSLIERRIELLDYSYKKNINDLTSLVKEGFKEIIRRDDIQNSTIKDIVEKTEAIERSVQSTQGIDIEEVNKIQDANILIVNNTLGCSGSGTYIKLDKGYFILSCAHLIDEETDTLVGILDNGKTLKLEIVKFDVSKDLSLLKIKTPVNDLAYLELSSEHPKSGSAIVVIGNPDFMTDVITEGVIANVKPTNYIITNLIYYGNSGGAVIYKGKVVGVVTQFRIFFNPPVFVNYGYAISLTEIYSFLEGIL